MATSTTPTPNSGAAEDILVFAVGKYRTTVERMGPVFRGTPFRFVGILDTASSREPYTFTPDRLRLALRVLYPRPRCFVAGEAIEAGQNAAAVEVWREFVDETDVENPLLINLREDPKGRSVEEIAEIPKEQLMGELVERMRAHFFGGLVVDTIGTS